MLKTTYTLRGKSRQGTWQELLEQAMPDADNADMTSLRYAYALSDEYDPYYEKGGVKATIRQVRQAAESGDAPRTVRAAERLLAMNPMHLETRQHLIEACLDASQEERAVPHQHFLRSCLRSIHGSGYGNSFRNAYVVISLDEEYAFLRMFGAIDGFEYRGKRRLAEDAGHAFDVFEVQRKGGDKDEIYFNIDLITKGVREERARLPDAKEELL
jgi:hypothetical protein